MRDGRRAQELSEAIFTQIRTRPGSVLLTVDYVASANDQPKKYARAERLQIERGMTGHPFFELNLRRA